MRDHTKIDAWKLADDLAVAVYEITMSFPREEMYGLVSQLRRAAVSVPANIAEGSARGSQRDYLHFLYIARGSLTEVQYLIHLSGRLAFVTDEARAAAYDRVKNASRCLQGLINVVEKEAGRVGRTIAGITSMPALSFATWSFFVRT